MKKSRKLQAVGKPVIVQAKGLRMMVKTQTLADNSVMGQFVAQRNGGTRVPGKVGTGRLLIVYAIGPGRLQSFPAGK